MNRPAPARSAPSLPLRCPGANVLGWHHLPECVFRAPLPLPPEGVTSPSCERCGGTGKVEYKGPAPKGDSSAMPCPVCRKPPICSTCNDTHGVDGGHGETDWCFDCPDRCEVCEHPRVVEPKAIRQVRLSSSYVLCRETR